MSTDRQFDRALSIPAQLAAMRQYATSRHWVVMGEYVEEAVSGRISDRPALRALLARCSDNGVPPVHVVLVHKIDRLARNLADHVAIRGILSEQRVALASVVENLDDSVSGMLVENIMASLAEFYSANLSEEVKKGMRQRVLQGGWPHCPPRGYLVVRSADGSKGKVVVDPVLGPAVQRAFLLARNGFATWQQLRQALAVEGLAGKDRKPLAASAVERLLRNPFYKGVIRWKGESYVGVHEPLVEPAVFEQVQRVLTTRRPSRRRVRHEFLMRGLATCVCGGAMTGEPHGRHRYYRCLRRSASTNACRSRYCNAEVAHVALERAYRAVRLSEVARRQLVPNLQDQAARQDVFPALQMDLRRGRRIDLRGAETLWDVHCRLEFPAQQVLLSLVFEKLVLNESGIASAVLKPSFGGLGDSTRVPLRPTA